MALLQLFAAPSPMPSSIACFASSFPLSSTAPLHISPCFASLAQHSHSFLKNNEDAVVPPLPSIKHPVTPSQPSVFAEEAYQLVARRAQAWGMLPGFFDYYGHVGVTITSFCFPGCISAQRLATAAGLIGLHFFLDDLLFDRDDVRVEAHGLHRDGSRDPASIEKFWFRLDTIFRSPVPPVNPIPIERAYWETGRQMQRDSYPKWFQFYADEVQTKYFVTASANKKQKHVRDVNAYIDKRIPESFGPRFIALLEFVNEIFLPRDVRADPRLQQLSHLCQVHGVLTNDIYSFDEKETTHESNSSSIIKLLMDTRCMSFAQAAKQAIELANNVTDNFAEIEAELPGSLELESFVYRYVLGLKQIITMNCEWHKANKRYLTPNSRFPQLSKVVF